MQMGQGMGPMEPQMSQTPPAELQNAGFPALGGAFSAEKVISQMPTSIQQRYADLPKSAQKALVQKGSM